MVKSNRERLLLRSQIKEVAEASFRFVSIEPEMEHKNTFIELRVEDNVATIDWLDEIYLYILSDLKFLPIWQLEKWLSEFNRDDVYEKIESYLKVGLIWVDSDAVNIYIRPTKFLFNMFGIEDIEYNPIQYNLLNHTCAEAEIMFDIMSANINSEIWNIIKLRDLKVLNFSPLNIEKNNNEESGNVILRESSYRLKRWGESRLIDRELELRNDIESGKEYTLEFQDFSRFPIVTKDKKGNLITQTPDLIIPIGRKDKLPQSVAIEIELSAKGQDNYNQIMLNYKNNLKFGYLIYLCHTNLIEKLVRRAFENVGGLGSCQLIVLRYIPPAIQFNSEDYKLDNTQLSVEDLLEDTDKQNKETITLKLNI